MGTVVCGLLTDGMMSEGDLIKIGPDLKGTYHTRKIESIHRNKQPVRSIKPGEAASIAISLTKFFSSAVEIRKV